MKKFLAALCIFLCTCSLFATTIKIMSFNVDGFDDEKRNKNHQVLVDGNGQIKIRNEIWFNNVCTIIKNSGADIVLMQEFYIQQNEFADKAVEYFCSRLGGSWVYISTKDYINKGKNYSEDQNNIIFYNNTKVNKSSNIIVNFSSPSEYRFAKNNTQVVEFSVSGEATKKFLIINVHLPRPAEKGKGGKHESDLESLENMFRDFKNKDYRFVIGGDFNESYQKLKNRKFDGAFIDSDRMESLWTMVYNAPKKNEDIIKARIPKNGGPNDLDHFIVFGFKANNMHHVFRHDWESGRRDYSEGITIGAKRYTKPDDYRKNVSDHLPIMIELEL